MPFILRYSKNSVQTATTTALLQADTSVATPKPIGSQFHHARLRMQLSNLAFINGEGEAAAVSQDMS